jgi:tRNA threonylcarbamoyladenosine biosynthesis protein TsaE
LPAGSVVALDGELGSGKTRFVRGLARGLGIAEPVSSPTYTLMHSYEGEGARLPLYHFDAWMAGREAAFLEGGGVEWMLGEGISAVEWAERVADLLPVPRLSVCLALRDSGGEGRVLRLAVVGVSAALSAALAALSADRP